MGFFLLSNRFCFRPLSEPKELKVRFDAIFEVTKYVKALDQIKKNIKDLELKLNNGDSLLPNLQDNMRLKANVCFTCFLVE